MQWTARLGGLASEKASGLEEKQSAAAFGKLKADGMPIECSVEVSLRLEGPYFLSADPYRYQTVVCMVAGTGISGALAIAAAYNHACRRTQEPDESGNPSSTRQWRKCIILWSVKASEDIELPILEPMSEGLSLRKFLTGVGRKRADLEQELGDSIDEGVKTWVYISGPKSYIVKAEGACKQMERRERLDYFAASWDI